MKSIERDFGRLMKRQADEVEALAEKARRDVVVPVCKEHHLDYLAGMGRVIFTGDLDGEEVNVTSVYEAENSYDGHFKFLVPVFNKVVDLEVDHNSVLGYYIRDVNTRRPGQRRQVWDQTE